MSEFIEKKKGTFFSYLLLVRDLSQISLVYIKCRDDPL
jgi:hypothetical protein